MEGERAVRNPLVREALGGAKLPGEKPRANHGEAIRAAYALRESDTDPDTLAFDYGAEIASEVPYDWRSQARELVVGWMREAYAEGQPHLLAALEPIREYETVQQELALEDMNRRYVEPRRAERRRREEEARPAE